MPHGAEARAAHHHMPAGHAASHEHGGARQEVSPVNGTCGHGAEVTPSLMAARNSDVVAPLLATVPSSRSIGLVPAGDDISAPESAWPGRPGTPLAVQLRV